MTIDDQTKLLLLKEPVRRTIETLRTLSNECDCLDDEGSVGLHNMALWLEGILEGNPSYTNADAIASAKTKGMRNET